MRKKAILLLAATLFALSMLFSGAALADAADPSGSDGADPSGSNGADPSGSSGADPSGTDGADPDPDAGEPAYCYEPDQMHPIGFNWDCW